MRRQALLKAEGLMYAAQHALEKGDTEAAIRYLEQAIDEVREYAREQE